MTDSLSNRVRGGGGRGGEEQWMEVPLVVPYEVLSQLSCSCLWNY